MWKTSDPRRIPTTRAPGGKAPSPKPTGAVTNRGSFRSHHVHGIRDHIHSNLFASGGTACSSRNFNAQRSKVGLHNAVARGSRVLDIGHLAREDARPAGQLKRLRTQTHTDTCGWTQQHPRRAAFRIDTHLAAVGESEKGRLIEDSFDHGIQHVAVADKTGDK